jgi:hypothetical protein
MDTDTKESTEETVNINLEKVVLFEKNVRLIFDLCKKINTIYHSDKLLLSKNIIMDSLDNFISIYEKINDPAKTIPLFEEIYEGKKIQILSGSKDWFRDKLVVEYPKVKKAKKRMALMISIFYSKAQELSDKAQKEINEYNDDKNADNVFLPEELELPFYEIFLLICKEDERKMLTEIRDGIKKELPGGNVNTAPPIGGLPMAGLLGSLLGGLDMGAIQKSMAEFGKSQAGGEGGESSSSGENGEGPSFGNMSEDQITGYIGSILRNPNTEKTIGKVVGSCKNITSIADIGKTIGDLMSDQELKDSMRQILPKPIDPQEMVREAQENCKSEEGVGESGESENRGE